MTFSVKVSGSFSGGPGAGLANHSNIINPVSLASPCGISSAWGFWDQELTIVDDSGGGGLSAIAWVVWGSEFSSNDAVSWTLVNPNKIRVLSVSFGDGDESKYSGVFSLGTGSFPSGFVGFANDTAAYSPNNFLAILGCPSASTRTKTKTAKARITQTDTKTQLAKSNVKVGGVKDQAAKARLTRQTLQTLLAKARLGNQPICGPLGPMNTGLDSLVASRGPLEIPANRIARIQPNLNNGTSSGGTNFMVPGGYFS